MADHRADVEDMDNIEFENVGNIMNNVAEYIRNMNEEFANIRDEMFEVLNKMEVNFEEIMNKDSSDKEVLSDDTGC